MHSHAGAWEREKIYREVDPDTHSAQVLTDLASLQTNW